jgi:two-component system, NarL family, nitrate/nitrite response regulator NarL
MTSPTALTLVLADDHAIFLDALGVVLSQAGHRIAAAVTSRAALIEQVRAVQPHICVTDTQFSDGYAIDVLDRLLDDSPDTRFIVLTADANPDTLRRALNAGAMAYVHKTRGVAVLIEALRRVAEGELVIEGSFSGPRPHSDDAPVEVRKLAAYLTPREVECLTLLAEGLATTAMAARLGISSTTVRSHVQALLVKLGVHSRLEAASLAIRHGLVTRPATTDATTPSTGSSTQAEASSNWGR